MLASGVAAAYFCCIICLHACTSATVRGMSLAVVAAIASADRTATQNCRLSVSVCDTHLRVCAAEPSVLHDGATAT